MKKYPKIRRPKSVIKACEKLIKAYEVGESLFDNCPLCRVCEACSECPWKIFKWKDGAYCGHAVDGKYTFGENIHRLKSWIKIIESQINGTD